MARNRYIKSHSNYTLKSFTQNTNVGNIYERDYMTVASMNTPILNGQRAYDLSSFKMVEKPFASFKKRYKSGKWVKNDSCGGRSNFWTEQCMGQDYSDDRSDSFKLKPNYKSLLDFACYGSAYEMVYSSVNDILARFPAEVVLLEEYTTINGKSYYFTDNEFDIDFSMSFINNEKGLENPLRFFSQSIDKYDITGAKGLKLNLSWEAENVENNCPSEGDILSTINIGNGIELYYIIYNGKKTLFHNHMYSGEIHITPKYEIREKFFRELEGFEEVMLNRNTKYTMVLNTPQMTDKGYIEYEMWYQWPLSKTGWNLDISSINFLEYIEKIYDIAKFYDDNYTDNLWRSMTHESIINFDWTFSTEKDGHTEEAKMDSRRVKSYIKVIGRQFDDIKRYSDGIRYMSNISYNGINNAPDSLISDKLKISGWETKNVVPTFSNYYMTEPLYDGEYLGKNADDANKEFLRRLLINSRYILSNKGTKRGIEALLAMFGLRSVNFIEHSLYTETKNGKSRMVEFSKLPKEQKNRIMANSYELNEFVYVAGEGSTAYMDENVEKTKEINMMKLDYVSELEGDEDSLQGLPVKEVNTYDMVSDTIKSYLIPWFDRREKYDGGHYFESKGGWGKKNMKIVPSSNGKDVRLISDGRFSPYDETSNYMRYAETIDELSTISINDAFDDEICYVYDLSGIETYNFGKENTDIENMSHFFVLKNKENCTYVGNVKISDSGKEIDIEGWMPVTVEELENISDEGDITINAKLVYNMESIVDDNTGNNPHTGFGKYDDGNEYVSNFRNIFKGAIDKDSFREISDSRLPWKNDDGTTDESRFIGFNLDKQIDNVKCWFFTDTSEEHRLKRLIFDETEGKYSMEKDYTYPEVGIDDTLRTPKSRGLLSSEKSDDTMNENVFMDRLDFFHPYNMEGGIASDEASANSVINSKKMNILFHFDKYSPLSMYDFINDTVMFYVKQMVPSTTLLQYNIYDKDMESVCGDATYIQSVITE